METPRKFIIAIINLHSVSAKLNKYIVFTMQTYKELKYFRYFVLIEVLVNVEYILTR